MLATNVTPVKISSVDFDWSFKPFFLWMRLIGIDLDPSRQFRSDFRRYLVHFYGGCLLILHLVIASQFGMFKFNVKEHLSPIRNTVSFHLNDYINTTNAILSYIILHILLLITTGDSWNDLRQILLQIECQYPLQPDHFKRCRRVFLFGLTLVFLVRYSIVLFNMSINLFMN